MRMILLRVFLWACLVYGTFMPLAGVPALSWGFLAIRQEIVLADRLIDWYEPVSIDLMYYLQ